MGNADGQPRNSRNAGLDAAGGRPRAESAPDLSTRDFQTLLSDAVQRLHARTASPSVIAWALRDDATPYVVAAAFSNDSPRAPDAAEFATVSTLAPVGRLNSSPALTEIAERHRLTAAATVSIDERPPMALLLLGPDAPRPRTLAALKAVARGLEAPLAAVLAAGRLAKLDRDVRQMDRLAALGTLAAEIVHEVRNPLVSVKTFLQLLPDRWGDPEFSGEFYSLVSEELRRMERLLDAIIEHARPTVGDLDRTAGNLANTLNRAQALLRPFADRRKVDIQTQLAADLPRVALGEDGLRQVVLNLLLNAIEATPPDGAVFLRAKMVGDSIEFRVCDEGPGIAVEFRDAIFEPFYSTRSERCGGLGLAISRRIVSEAGGNVTVHGPERGGTEFRVRLPIAKR